MQTTPRDAIAGSRREPDRTGPDDLRYSLRISVWVRWFLLIRPGCCSSTTGPTSPTLPMCRPRCWQVSLLALNGYVHYRTNWTKSRTLVLRFRLDL